MTASIGIALRRFSNRRGRPVRAMLGVVKACLAVGPLAASTPDMLPGRVIGVVRDFEPGDNAHWEGAVSSANHAEFHEIPNVREYSSDTPFGLRCWRLDVRDPVPFSGYRKAGWDRIDKIFLVGLMKIPHLPPEVDVVRLRCKVLEGSFQLSAGGPVIQAGTSDVFADPVEVTAENCKEWRVIDLSLNHRLMRNFRRARYSKDSPVIYHSRWAQEDFCLVGLKKSTGVILIDQIEFVSMGEGRPFPRFEPASIRHVSKICDFEDEGDLGRVASIIHGYDSGQGQEDSFVQSWRRNPLEPNVARWSDKNALKLDHEPVRLGITNGASLGRKALSASAHFAEEHSYGLIRVPREPHANAFRFVMKVTGRSPDLRTDPRNYWGTAVDFLVLVGEESGPFPWDMLAASEELRRHPGPGFDYEISLKRTAGLTFGYYHARRLFYDDRWTTVVIPFADFACGYGQGPLAETFRKQLPLNGSRIVGIMYTGPIRFEMEIVIDEVSYVHVPGAPEELQSYWQDQDPSTIVLTEHSWLRPTGVQAVRGEP